MPFSITKNLSEAELLWDNPQLANSMYSEANDI